MKNKFFVYLIALAIVPAFNACDHGIPDDLKFTQFMSVYFIPAQNGNSTMTLLGAKDTTMTFPGVRYGGTTQPIGVVTADIAINTSLVDAYNTANETNYLPMPAGSCSLDKSTLTVSSNDFVSDEFTLNINDNSLLEEHKSYLIPITVTSVNSPESMSLNETYKTAYVIVNRLPSEEDLRNEMNEHLKGSWLFDDASNPFKATVGADIQPGSGTWGDLHFEGAQGITSIAGPSSTNKAISKPMGSFLKINHNIGANGGGSNVNEFTLQMDIRIADVAGWYSLYQTDLTNSTDAKVWAHNSDVGFFQSVGWGDLVDYDAWPAAGVLKSNTWHRILLTHSSTTHTYTIYVDGVQAGTVTNPDIFLVDGVFSLDAVSVLLGADAWGYDGSIDIAEVAIWDIALTADHAALLGKVK